MHKVAFRSR